MALERLAAQARGTPGHAKAGLACRPLVSSRPQAYSLGKFQTDHRDAGSNEKIQACLDFTRDRGTQANRPITSEPLLFYDPRNTSLFHAKSVFVSIEISHRAALRSCLGMEYAERRAGQPQRLCRAAFFWLVLAGCALVGTAQAQYGYGGLGQELASGGGLHEQEARFLPGIYYFDKGCEYARRGDIPAAVGAWLISAGWAMKPAQYNLGIVYFGGLGVPADRPRGLAWLALAAEREDSAFAEALAEAWDSATSAEHDEANKLWRALRERYADAVALPRAQKRYHDEASHITGSRVGMPGNVKVSAPGGLVDGASYLRRMSRRAELNFGRLPAGHVDVGPIESLDIPLPGPDD